MAMAKPTEIQAKPQGVVTQYYELRFAPPVHNIIMKSIVDLSESLKQQPGFLGLSFKQMVGLSTMVNNFPSAYKGVLRSAYAEAVEDHSLPYFYSLFLRFASYSDAQKINLDTWFQKSIMPQLYLFTSKGKKTDIPVSYYADVFQTIAAGNREAVYTTPTEIKHFLRNQKDIPEQSLITVNNHLAILDKDMESFEQKVLPLLKVAQNTFEPRSDPKNIGQPGDKSNQTYHRAMSTEILRNAFPAGEQRNYMMHGVWESVWDHENSHLDPRFRKAAMPVAAYAVSGPVEPFYQTHLLMNN